MQDLKGLKGLSLGELKPGTMAFGAWGPLHLVISPLKLLDMGEIDNEDESGSDHGLKLKIRAYLVPSKPFSPQRYPEVVKKLS